METKRDRASGWQYAKLSGHRNEDKVKLLFNKDDYCRHFSERLNIPQIKDVVISGLHEQNTNCILGGSTKSKTDLTLNHTDNSTTCLSIKKSWGGQVFLISVNRFIDGYERQFNTFINEDIKDTLYLYFYGSPKTREILEEPKATYGQSQSLINYQKRKNRLTWETLEKYDQNKAKSLLNWFKENIGNIADLCFSRGLASENCEWADYIWYINLLSEDNDNTDDIYKIDDIKKASTINAELMIEPGHTNGGSTIQLPFGFVQWHQGKMQFHHSLEKIRTIVKSRY